MFLLRVIYRLVYISYVSFVLLSKKINTGVIFLYLCPSVYKTSSGVVSFSAPASVSEIGEVRAAGRG